MKLKAIANPERCDRSGCGREWSVRYLEGSTLLNPGKRVKLCDEDSEAWLDEESALRVKLFGDGRSNCRDPYNGVRKKKGEQREQEAV